MTDDALRRHRLLRRDRRPRLQADLPGPAGARARRGRERADRRRRQGRLGPRPVPRRAPRTASTTTAATTPAFARLAVAAALRRRRLQRRAHLRCSSSRRSAGAKRPLHYLAIPPALFGVVVAGLAAAGLSDNARLVVEKPFGRDRASAARAQRDFAASISRRNRSSASTTTSARSRCRTSSTRASPTPIFEPLWNRHYVRSHPDHHGGSRSACRTAAPSTTRPARCATLCRTICCRCSPT